MDTLLDDVAHIKGEWLDSVKPGYSRFTAAFAAAGYQDAEDLKIERPTPQQLEHLLAGVTAAKAPQIEHLIQGLAALSPNAGATAALTGVAAVVQESVAGSASVPAGGTTHTPHKYLQPATATPSGSASASALSSSSVSNEVATERGKTIAAATADVQAKGASSRLARTPVSASLLPDGKHAFLSYQWGVQDQVKKIKSLLNERRIKCNPALPSQQSSLHSNYMQVCDVFLFWIDSKSPSPPLFSFPFLSPSFSKVGWI